MTTIPQRLREIADTTEQYSDQHSRYVAENLRAIATEMEAPIDMVLHCPECGAQHIDAVTKTWPNEPHRTHLCSQYEQRWRPADVSTNGVAAVKTHGKDDSPIVVRKGYDGDRP